MSAPHPAKFSKELMPVFVEATEGYEWILDPFAGVGGVHELLDHGHVTRGVEIEPEWAEQSEYTIVGSALELDWEDGQFDAIVTSPCYGSRMADHHDAKDDSKRHTYRHYLGRELHPDNTGKQQWGGYYRDFHYRAWVEALRVLRDGGRFVLNIKDHIRKGQRQHVSGWHVSTLFRLGLDLLYHVEVPTKGNGHGANADVRAGNEMVYVFEKRKTT